MTRSLTQLAWPLAISVALHLGFVLAFSAGALQLLPKQPRSLTLTVTLAGNPQPTPQKSVAPDPPIVPPELPAAATTQEGDGQITRKARFLVAPDLSTLEDISVSLSGSLTLRLHVSALGTVDRVTVIKSDPVPKELLDGLLDRLGSARLAPAQAGSRPVASTLDLVIRYEVAPMPLQQDR